MLRQDHVVLEFNVALGMMMMHALVQVSILHQVIRGSNLAMEGGLKGFENIVKRTSNGAYGSRRCPAVTKHPMRPGGSSIISL